MQSEREVGAESTEASKELARLRVALLGGQISEQQYLESRARLRPRRKPRPAATSPHSVVAETKPSVPEGSGEAEPIEVAVDRDELELLPADDATSVSITSKGTDLVEGPKWIEAEHTTVEAGIRESAPVPDERIDSGVPVETETIEDPDLLENLGDADPEALKAHLAGLLGSGVLPGFEAPDVPPNSEAEDVDDSPSSAGVSQGDARSFMSVVGWLLLGIAIVLFVMFRNQ